MIIIIIIIAIITIIIIIIIILIIIIIIFFIVIITIIIINIIMIMIILTLYARLLYLFVPLVKHVFTNPLFEQRARSYLKPCGHPWAALVMFDSVLVRTFCT